MRKSIITTILACICYAYSYAQPVLTPRNMALGGGGSTYITNYNANFYNPANLMIQDKFGTFEIGVMLGGFYFDGVQNFGHPLTQFDNAQDYIKKYQRGQYEINQVELNEIVDNNYPGTSQLSTNRTRYDATLLGMKWKKTNQSFSFAIRTRTSSSYSVGKGWYDSSFSSEGDYSFINRSLIHRYQTLHEISFGYAETFRFLTNLTSKLDNFTIGIAPKLVFGGSYQDAVWDNFYYQNPETGQVSRVQEFYYAGTGQFSDATSDFVTGESANNAVMQNINNDLMSLDGVGAGLDIGVTYLLTFGSDLSAVRPGVQPTRKSLRLSFSMTDIGFVSYSSRLQKLIHLPDTSFSPSLPLSPANEAFIGARGQYLGFIEQFGEDNPFITANSSNSNFSVLLPMAIHGGALLEINRLKLMGDISVGLTDNAFNSTTLISSVGIELRPFMFLPLRAGTQFEAQRPSFLSVGTAIETKHWDLSVAAQFTPKSLISEVQLTGISVATLQFHF